MVGTDVRAKLAKFFTASRVDSMLKLVNHSKLDKLLSDVAEAAGKATNQDVKSTFDLFCIIVVY